MLDLVALFVSGAAGSASARAAPSAGWSTAKAWTPGTEPWAKASAPVKAPSDMELLYADKRIAVAVKPPGVLSTDEPGGMPELLRAQLGTPCIRLPASRMAVLFVRGR